MLVKPELEKLLPKVDNRYTLSIIIAKRVRQLLDGAQPMTEPSSPNLVTIACDELAEGKVVCVKGQVKPYVPLRPEVEAARLAAKAEEEQANMAEAVKDAIDQAAGIEPESQVQADDVHLINENLITISEDIGESDDEGIQAVSPEADDVTEASDDEQINEATTDEQEGTDADDVQAAKTDDEEENEESH